jgi:hypothetical protein
MVHADAEDAETRSGQLDILEMESVCADLIQALRRILENCEVPDGFRNLANEAIGRAFAAKETWISRPKKSDFTDQIDSRGTTWHAIQCGCCDRQFRSTNPDEVFCGGCDTERQ